MGLKRRLFDPGKPGALRDLGLLVLRLGFGWALIYGHGWGKLLRLLDGQTRFADPLGIGAPATLVLAVLAEVVCAGAVILGITSRWATLPLIATFAVAFFVHHAADPFGDKELAYAYLVTFVGLMLTGPGRYSVDGLLRRR